MSDTLPAVPDAIEQAIQVFGTTAHVCGMDDDPPHLVWSLGKTLNDLRQTIRAALAEQEQVRERCETLRQAIVGLRCRYEREDTGVGFPRGELAWAMYTDLDSVVALLADDLAPRSTEEE